MPRNYKNYSEKNLKTAIEKVRAGELSIRKAAFLYNVLKTTLHEHFRGNRNKPVGHPTVMSTEEEQNLLEAAEILAKNGLQLSRFDFRHLAKTYLDSSSRKTNFPLNFPTKKWLQGFLTRHPTVWSVTNFTVVILIEKCGQNATNVTCGFARIVFQLILILIMIFSALLVQLK